MKSAKIEKGINGIINIPGDKSISHRSIIIPSISNGVCEVSNILKSEDVINTLNAFKALGVKFEETKEKLIVYGKGINSLKKSSDNIYLGNSGTSARLLIGLLASQKFDSVLTGDSSLSSRPMERIVNPLNLMNAKIDTNSGKMPIKIYGNDLKNTEIEIDIPSAQIKSGLILAALNTKGTTKIIEKHTTRNQVFFRIRNNARINVVRTKKNNPSDIGRRKIRMNIFRIRTRP